LHVFDWRDVDQRGIAAEEHLVPQVLVYCIVIDLSGVKQLLTWLLTCDWGSSSKFLLSRNSSSGVSILTLLALLICLSILWWYVYRNDQDLAI
jgi:hypothetical protein